MTLLQLTLRRVHAALGGRLVAANRALCALIALSLAGGAASLLIVGVLPATAASGQTTTTTSCPSSNPPDELTLAGGTPQSAKLGAPFSAPFQVALANSNGCPVTTPVAGTPVTFDAPSNGSTTASGAFAASGSSSVTVGTDANGSASASAFVANDIAGSYTVVASSNYGSVSFALTNTAAGIAATIAAETPVSQAAFTGAVYVKPLQALVLDANGNPVYGATVAFTLGSSGSGGGGAGAAASAGADFAGGQPQATALTDAAGIATSPPLTANSTPGRFTATAATEGVTEPASFGLDNVAGAPPKLELVGSRHRSASVDDGYRAPLLVELVAATGKPVQGATVTFTLGSSGGSAGAGGGAAASAPGASFVGGGTEASETTGPRGRATSPAFTANGTAGTFTATVTVTGLSSPLIVALDNLAGKTSKITPLGSSKGSATAGARFEQPLEVRVRDGAGKPVQGATVTFSLGAGGAGGSGASASAGASFLDGAAQATETTGADGLAVSPLFTANATPGAFTATASVAGITNPALFRLRNLIAPAPTITPVARDLRTARVGDRYPTPLTVRATGANGKPLQGATVTFSLAAAAAGGGGAGSAGSAGASFLGGATQASETTNAAGRAVSPPFSANTVSGSFTATASMSGTTRVASFPLHNLAGKPASISAGAAATEATAVGTRYPIRLAVTVTANPVAGVLVTFAAPARGPSGRFGHGRSRADQVRTNAAGIAVAPALVANHKPGGYVVTATVEGSARAAAFALVNQPPGQTP